MQERRQNNRAAILHHLRTHGQLSRAALAELTSLSKPSISTMVEELLQEGWVREVGTGESNGGRRPILLEINAEGAAIVGAVFEGTGLDVSVADLNGEVLAEQHVVIHCDACSDSILDALQAHIHEVLAKAGVDDKQVLGLGLGLPGVTSSGRISFSPSTGWQDWPVDQELEKRMNRPVFLENDVNLMALGEYYKGAGRGYQHLVYMHVGTGIGSGIILDGGLYRGFSNAAGEIGYMVVGSASQRDHSAYGAFESNYSAQAIRTRMERDPALRLLLGKESAVKTLFDHADTLTAARELLQDTCLHWAYGMANLICVLNPELIILGGDMAQIGDSGLQFIGDSLERLVPVVPDLKTAELGARGGVIGAVFHVLEADRSLTGRLGGKWE